jgi:selenocysteine lyase/cysteine desulfurase
MIYLDNAATSWPKPESVYVAVDDWQRRIGVGPGRGDSSMSAEVARRIDRCRRDLAALLGGEARLTVFALNATDAINLLVKGLLREADHVVSSRAEHNAVVRPLRALESAGQIQVDK